MPPAAQVLTHPLQMGPEEPLPGWGLGACPTICLACSKCTHQGLGLRPVCAVGGLWLGLRCPARVLGPLEKSVWAFPTG